MPLVLGCCYLVLRVGPGMPEGFSQAFLLPFQFLAISVSLCHRGVWERCGVSLSHGLASSPEVYCYCLLLLGSQLEQSNFFCFPYPTSVLGMLCVLGPQEQHVLRVPFPSCGSQTLVWLFLGEFPALLPTVADLCLVQVQDSGPEVVSLPMGQRIFTSILILIALDPCLGPGCTPLTSVQAERFCLYFSSRSSISLLVVLGGGEEFTSLFPAA